MTRFYKGIDPALVKDPGLLGNVLVTESKLRRVEIRIDSLAPRSSESGEPYPSPAKSATFITVTVSAPISQ